MTRLPGDVIKSGAFVYSIFDLRAALIPRGRDMIGPRKWLKDYDQDY
jgi:hypothetical protein